MGVIKTPTGLCIAPRHLNHKTCTLCTQCMPYAVQKYLRCTKPANLDAIHQRMYCVDAHLPVTATICGKDSISGVCKASQCDEQCWLKYLRGTLPTAINMPCTKYLKLTANPANRMPATCVKVSQGITTSTNLVQK